MKHILLCLVSVAILSSCDIVEPPFRKEVGPRDTTNNDDSLSSKRIVLLEKFTGAACAPCPNGNDEAKRLVEVYKDISVISYHVGQFAKPEPAGGYIYDFRTPIGDEIGLAFFKPQTVDNIQTPLAGIDRIGYDTVTSIRLTYRNWEKRVIERDTTPSPVAIRLYPWYDPNTKTITVSGSIHYLEPGFKDYMLTIAVIEDSIVKPQKQPDGGKITDYVHKSVFRANIPNTTWGSPVSSTEQPKGSKIEFTRSLQLANDSDWEPKHLKVVGYVYRNFNTPRVSREVLQSKTEKVNIVP